MPCTPDVWRDCVPGTSRSCQPTGKLPCTIGWKRAPGQEAPNRRGTRPPMALAYTAFGYFSLLIILALLLPGH
jgi:hypothetical protein